MEFKISRILIVLFLISLFLNVYGIWWGLPNYFSWAVDDFTPNTPLLVAKNMFKVDTTYPIFHFILLDVIYSPYLAYLYLSGGLINPHQGFPYGFTNPLTSLTVLLILSRLVSAVMGALTVVFVYLSVKSLYGKTAALFSALCIAFSHIIILYSHFGNMDIPYTLWLTIALYFYIRVIKTYKARYYMFLGIFTGLAVSTKEQILGFFVLLPLPLIYLHCKHHIREGLSLFKTIFHKKLLYCLAAVVLTYILATNVIFNFSGYIFRLQWYNSNVGKFVEFPNTFLGQIQLFTDALFKLEYSTGIVLFLLFLISFFYCLYRFDGYTFAFLIPLISYYVINIARLRFVYYRTTIPFIIVLSFFAGKFLSDIIRNVRIKKYSCLIIILIFVYTFFYGFSADLSLVYDSRYSAEEWMLENIDKDSKIEVYHQIIYLPRFHALGYENVSMVFFNYNGTEKPPVLLFKSVTDFPSLESLNRRNPDYIIIPDCCYDINNYDIKLKEYMGLLLSERAGYKIVKKFDNKIPFAPEPPPLDKRTNIPIIILKHE